MLNTEESNEKTDFYYPTLPYTNLPYSSVHSDQLYSSDQTKLGPTLSSWSQFLLAIVYIFIGPFLSIPELFKYIFNYQRGEKSESIHSYRISDSSFYYYESSFNESLTDNRLHDSDSSFFRGIYGTFNDSEGCRDILESNI